MKGLGDLTHLNLGGKASENHTITIAQVRAISQFLGKGALRNQAAVMMNRHPHFIDNQDQDQMTVVDLNGNFQNLGQGQDQEKSIGQEDQCQEKDIDQGREIDIGQGQGIDTGQGQEIEIGKFQTDDQIGPGHVKKTLERKVILRNDFTDQWKVMKTL